MRRLLARRFLAPAVAASLAVLPVLAVTPAHAQAGIPQPSLPPYEVLTIIRSVGFDPAGQPVLRGGVYVIRAIDFDGIPVRVAVNARSGQIVSVIETPPVTRFGAPAYENVRRPSLDVPYAGPYRAKPRRRVATRTPVPRPSPKPVSTTGSIGGTDAAKPAPASMKQSSAAAAKGKPYPAASWRPVPVAPLD